MFEGWYTINQTGSQERQINKVATFSCQNIEVGLIKQIGLAGWSIHSHQTKMPPPLNKVYNHKQPKYGPTLTL